MGLVKLVKVLFFTGMLVLIISCRTYDPTVNDNIVILNSPHHYQAETIFNKDVVIYPGAFLKTSGKGKVIFTKKVSILGESQVFDPDVNLHFVGGTLSTLNPAWFGAKGYDMDDDTDAFEKVLELATAYSNSVSVLVPVGNFKISRTLRLGNVAPNGKSINLTGVSMSANAQSGSCLEWNGPPGSSLFLVENYNAGMISDLDFTSHDSHPLKYNVEIRPFAYQISFRNCSFSGCSGTGSANLNLNKGNNLQVSEISFEHCLFKGMQDKNGNWKTESAIIGGLANTKNFSFSNCSFMGYTIGGINVEVSDILRVQNCNFAHNETDIICLLCNSMFESNYSENSGSFFRATVSDNISFTTMVGNYFFGASDSDDVISGGTGSLVLINNNFGGLGGVDITNRIQWSPGKLSHIYSVGNFFRNGAGVDNPFVIQEREGKSFQTFGDKVGTSHIDIRQIRVRN